MDRLRALKKQMKAHKADAAVIVNPRDVGYLTGFMGGDSVLVVGSAKASIISDMRYAEELGAYAHLATLRLRDGAMTGAIAGELAHRGARAVLVQAEHTTVQALDTLRDACKKARIGAKALKPVANLLGPARRSKDAYEVGRIRMAVNIQQEALEAALDQMGPGMSELEAAALIEYEMKARGSTEPAFHTMVGAGPNAARPHHSTGTTLIRRGEPVLIDFGATVDGYRSDMTRVVCFGRWPREWRDMYEIVLEAHEASAKRVKPGTPCRDVDAAARNVIDRTEFAGLFTHSLGHGLGLDVHEAPTLSAKAPEDLVLEPGDIVTIEPGVYQPGVGGVRLENDYLVTDRGVRKLCTLPMDIDWASR